MQENYAEQARRMREWMRREGYDARVIRLSDGRPALVPGETEDRSRQARWDAKNRVTVSCSAPVQVADAFREACEAEGYTPYAVLRRFIDAVIQEHRRVTAARASARPGGPPRSSARLGNGRGEWTGRGTAGTPRGRSPRPPWSGIETGKSPGLRKARPAPYDWQEDEELRKEAEAERQRLMRIVDRQLAGPSGKGA